MEAFGFPTSASHLPSTLQDRQPGWSSPGAESIPAWKRDSETWKVVSRQRGQVWEVQLQAETSGQNAQKNLKREKFARNTRLAGRTKPPDSAERRDVTAQAGDTAAPGCRDGVRSGNGCILSPGTGLDGMGINKPEFPSSSGPCCVESIKTQGWGDMRHPLRAQQNQYPTSTFIWQNPQHPPPAQ